MGGKSLAIRAGRPDEADRLTKIAHAGKRHWNYSEELIALWREDLTVTPDFVASHEVSCAVRDAEIVGFYALSYQGEAFELEHMWVDPSHIRTGVGSALFGHAIGVVRALGGSVLQ